MISFNSIPINLRVPGTYVEFDNSRAVQGLLPMPQRMLVFGQMRASGEATPGEPVLVTRPDQAKALFGRGSQLAAMIAIAYAVAPYVPIWAMPLADSDSGTAAARDIDITAAPVASGTLHFYVGGRRVSVGVAADDEAGDVATALAAAINADAEAYVTATAADSTVTLTAVHAGIDAGTLDVRHSYYTGEALPAGLGITINAATPGTGNPDITPALDALGDDWYQTIVMPWTDAANLSALEAELADRWGPMRQIEGQAFAATGGTVATVATAGEARNSPHLTLADAGATIAPAWLLAAADAALDAAEPDPARPRQTLQLPADIKPAPETARRNYSERNTLLYSGIATHTVSAAGRVQIERLVTTYQVNASGLEDTSYLDVTTLRTLAYMRYTVRQRITQRFPRHKLADDGTPVAPGQAIVTPNVIRAELISLFRDWMDIGIAEDIEQFKRDLIVERNAQDPNRLDAQIPPDVINQLRVFAAQVQFRL